MMPSFSLWIDIFSSTGGCKFQKMRDLVRALQRHGVRITLGGWPPFPCDVLTGGRGFRVISCVTKCSAASIPSVQLLDL